VPTQTDVDLGYDPRAPFVDFHKRTQRWAVLVVHRRGGKTVACVADLIDAALRCTKPRPRFAYIAPQLKQAKTVAWEYVKDMGLKVPGSTAHESELRLDLPNGGQVRLFGADNPDTLRGIYLDGVVLDEAGDMNPRLFNEILRPALADRKGWGVWIGTPKGMNDFYDLHRVAKDTPDEFYSMTLRASKSGLIDPDELESARKTMTPEQYAQEFECSFQAAIIGAYYGREMDAAEAAGRIKAGLLDPTIAVHTAWDLGMSDHTAIWFYQTVANEIRLVDFYANNSFGLEHYAKVLQDRGYVYGRHVLPHDVKVKELGTGRSRLETLEGLGIRCEIAPQLSIEDGINAVRRILPRCWFDEATCGEGIKALRQYRRKWDDTRKVFLEQPYHDWTSHPADSFRYLALSVEEPRTAYKPAKPRKMGWVL
jgi:hypothetical protein